MSNPSEILTLSELAEYLRLPESTLVQPALEGAILGACPS